jgi:ADP-ribose pyrophosphatase
MYEETVSRDVIFEGRVVTLCVDKIKDCYGRDGSREYIAHSGGVGIVALDAENNVFMIRQYRYGVSEVVLEIPAGKLERGEAPLECGKRELTEETGYQAEEFIDLGVIFPTPAYDSERIYIYLARGLTYVGQRFDAGEYLETERIPLEKAAGLVLSGEIKDAKTQIGLLKAKALLESRDSARPPVLQSL